jgi:glycosyltransferase involved in cell wall biosynthesis
VEVLNFRAMNRFARIIREQTELPLLCRRLGIDVLWCPGYTAPLVAACPVVTSILDMQYKRFPEDFSRMELAATQVLVGAAARRSKRIIAISDFSRKEIMKFAGVAASRIAVTPLGVDRVFGDAGVSASAGGPLAQTLAGRPFLLCVANSYPHKNLAMLVDAFRLLEDEVEHVLVIVGKKRRGEQALAAAVSGLKDPLRVVRIEGLSRSELVSAYQGAEVFVFPSLYEGFGLPVLEALMAGTTVVTTREGALPEVGGDYVRYAEPVTAGRLAACIRTALSEGGPADAASAGEWAERFTWERTGRRTLEELIAARTGNG